jgi:hypothetical protein
MESAMFVCTTLFTKALTSGKSLAYSCGLSVKSFYLAITDFVTLAVFKSIRMNTKAMKT